MLSRTFHVKLVKTIALFEFRYVPPEQAKVVASVHASISGSSASSTSSTPEVKPLKSLLGEAAPTLHLNKGTPSQVSNDKAEEHRTVQQYFFSFNGIRILAIATVT